jgi:hypothetical protein
MWQTVVVLLLLAIALIYVIRHFIRVFRAEETSCTMCSGCSCSQALNQIKPKQGEELCDHQECTGMKT